MFENKLMEAEMRTLCGKTLEEISIERLIEFEPPEGYFVAFSGGKDSIVILDLVQKSGVKYDAHYSLTTVDHPEVVRFIKTEYPGVIIDKPKRTMWQLIVDKKIPPTRIIRYCCSELKESSAPNRIVVTGVRWEESAKRSKRRMFEICRRNANKSYLHIIIEWTTTDVWQHIRKNNLKYPSLYDNGYKRLGCIGCPLSSNQEQELNDNPKYKAAYIKAFGRMLKNMNGNQQWQTGQDVYDWWVGNKQKSKDPEECMLFE